MGTLFGPVPCAVLAWVRKAPMFLTIAMIPDPIALTSSDDCCWGHRANDCEAIL